MGAARLQEDYPFFSDQMKEIILFRQQCPYPCGELLLKPLHLPRDIRTICRWRNGLFANADRPAEGSVGELYRFYEELLRSGRGWALMAFRKGRPIAQVDYYRVLYHELSRLYDYKVNDHGIHLLTGPCSAPVSGQVMRAALEFIFSLGISRVVYEPDIRDEEANRLALELGFQFQKQIRMSYKTANLYFLAAF